MRPDHTAAPALGCELDGRFCLDTTEKTRSHSGNLTNDLAAILSVGASAVWSMRRRSDAPTPVADLAKSDDLESPD